MTFKRLDLHQRAVNCHFSITLDFRRKMAYAQG
jgi:hypothetical protein